MFEAYQILPCKEVAFIKGDHEVSLEPNYNIVFV